MLKAALGVGRTTTAVSVLFSHPTVSVAVTVNWCFPADSNVSIFVWPLVFCLPSMVHSHEFTTLPGSLFSAFTRTGWFWQINPALIIGFGNGRTLMVLLFDAEHPFDNCLAVSVIR